MPKLIPLTQGQFAIVDDEDYEYLNQFKWCAHYKSDMRSYTAERKIYTKTMTSMHRFIMNPPRGFVIDHINHNTLDNRKCNLRICTYHQNNMNRKLSINNKSGYKGVHYDNTRKKWCSHIQFNKKVYNLGRYLTPIEAAIAYDSAALKYYGEFANLNFPDNADDTTHLA